MNRYDDDAYEYAYPDGSPMHECWNMKKAFSPVKTGGKTAKGKDFSSQTSREKEDPPEKQREEQATPQRQHP